MRQVGSWHLEGVVGAGNGGVVYSATCALDGRRALVKTIVQKRSELLGPLRREISALSELDHPGIVRIIDHGVDGVVPWYAMPRVSGTTLSDWFAANGVQAALRERLSICMRLAQTLAYLHGTGYVHGDIKPDNILVADGGFPVLVDFGLAGRFRSQGERVNLTAQEARGTPEYMSPERIRGWAVDSRSDLYAFGCLLFEASVGRPPFAGSASDVIRAQLNDRVPWATEVNPNVPVEVARLIDVLTRKSLRERSRMAREVAEELMRLLVGVAGYPIRESDACLPSPLLRGRDRELQLLKEQLASGMAAGTTSQIVLRGASGSGKTFLASEFCRSLPEGTRSIFHTCREDPHERRDFSAFLELLEEVLDACLERGPNYTRSILGEQAAIISLLDDRVLELPGYGSLRVPEIGSDAGFYVEVRQALEVVVGRWLRGVRALLVVDDAQWLDDASKTLLERIRETGSVPDLHVLIVETTEHLECASAFLPDGGRSVDLAPLPPSELVEVAKDLLGTQGSPPAELMTLVHEKAEGSPLFAAEIVRSAVAGRLIGLVEGSWRTLEDPRRLAGLGATENVKRIIRGRISALAAPLQQLLESIAILGEWADYARAEDMSSALGADFLRSVTQLIGAGFVREESDGGLAIAHHHYLRAVLDGLGPERSEVLHEHAARVLLRPGDEAGPDLLVAVAEHRRASGDALLEFEMRRSAGFALFHGGRHRESAAQLGRALEIGSADTGTVSTLEIHALLAEALSVIGESAESIRVAIAGIEQVGIRLPGPRGVPYLVRRVLHRPVARFTGMYRMPEDVARCVLRCLWVLSQEYFFQDDLVLGLSVNLLSVDIGDSNPGVEVPVRTYSAISAFAGIVGLRRTSLEYERLGRERAIRASSREAAGFWMSVSLMHGIRGEWRNALESACHAERVLESVLDPRQLEIIRVLQGHAQYFQGDLDASSQTFLDVGRMGREHENEQVIAWSEFSIARCHCVRGDFASAALLLRKAESRLNLGSEAQSWIITLGLLALCSLRAHRPAEALRYARRCLPYLYRAAPTGYPSLEGFAGVLEVLLSRPRLRPHARRVLGRFASFARLIPSARPRYLYYRSRYLEDSAPRRSAKLLRQASELAADMHMPVEVELCRARLTAGIDASRTRSSRRGDSAEPLGVGVRERWR